MTVETIRGVWIKRDKEVTPISYPRDDSDDTSLRVLQECVAGLIEPVRLAYGGTMYVNDSYRFHFGPDDFNSIASDLAGFCGRPDLMLSGILGDVAVVGQVDYEGYDTSISDKMLEVIRKITHEAGGTYVEG